MCQNSQADSSSSSSPSFSNMNDNHNNGMLSTSMSTTTTITHTDDEYSLLTDNQSNHNHKFKAMKLFQKTIYTLSWIILTYTSKLFSQYLSIHQSQAAQQTFIPAFYNYDDQNTYFDNTILTYGTDYLICILMTYASYKCFMTRTTLGYKSCALFGSYAISVFCGGVAHENFHGVNELNTWRFKLWWIICVGSVTAAGGFMGMCGSDILHYFSKANNNTTSTMSNNQRFDMTSTILSHSLWWIYGLYMTYICIMGEISYKRPACDIFVAGTTQFIPTMYCELSLLSMKWKDAIPLLEGLLPSSSTTTTTATTSTISRKVRIFFYIGFILNAPLLPSYPMLVQYTNLSLGVVNALLHLNLTFAWGMQAWSLYHICLIIKKNKGEGVEQQQREGGTSNSENKKYL